MNYENELLSQTEQIIKDQRNSSYAVLDILIWFIVQFSIHSQEVHWLTGLIKKHRPKMHPIVLYISELKFYQEIARKELAEITKAQTISSKILDNALVIYR